VYTCMQIEKRYLVKVFQEWGGIKENDGGGEFKYDSIYCKNFCKCHNVLPV
jgi:hypothetical protein